MNEMGLFGKRKKQKYHSYIGEVGRIAENIINRDFISDGPNKKKDRKIINSALAKKHRISELPATISKLIF